MDKYVRYTDIIPDCQIQSRMISHSLLCDIQSYISSLTINAPKAIAKSNKKDNELNKQINLMYGYTTVINKIPVTSKSDRHFTINSRGEMSYTPAGKPTYLSQDKSNNCRRRSSYETCPPRKTASLGDESRCHPSPSPSYRPE